MLERVWELTRDGKLSWNLLDDESIAYRTEGYFIEITPPPHTMHITQRSNSKRLETATPEDLKSSYLSSGANAYDVMEGIYFSGADVASRLALSDKEITHNSGPKFFVCYRRDDTKQIAGRVHDKLLTRWDADSIFFDIDSVPLGVDFRVFTRKTLTSCTHMLVLVGNQFVGARSEEPRIFDQNDLVRTELEMAFSMGLTIIPVTIDDARMPVPDLLPKEIQHFSFLNAAKLDSGADFHAHMSRIIKALETPKS